MQTKQFYFIFMLLWSFNVDGKTSNILKLSCEYDPKLIKKESNVPSTNDDQKINSSVICKSFGCSDIVEVNMHDKNNGEIEYRLRNSGVDHQGILLDDFLMTENKIKKTTTKNFYRPSLA